MKVVSNYGHVVLNENQTYLLHPRKKSFPLVETISRSTTDRLKSSILESTTSVEVLTEWECLPYSHNVDTTEI